MVESSESARAHSIRPTTGPVSTWSQSDGVLQGCVDSTLVEADQMKAFIDTNGCTLGQLETKRVQDFLERNDATVVLTPDPKEADVLIFFACGLTEYPSRLP